MSPTSLPGMKTATSPFGRDERKNGSMMDIAKILAPDRYGISCTLCCRRSGQHRKDQEGYKEGSDEADERRGILSHRYTEPMSDKLEDVRSRCLRIYKDYTEQVSPVTESSWTREVMNDERNNLFRNRWTGCSELPATSLRI